MAQYDNMNLQEIHDFLVSVAHDAGKMIVGARRPRVGGTGVKINSVDLVTETDKAVENMVATALRERYPDIGFLGEESYVPPTSSTGTSIPSLVPQTPTFIVDPIDGTTNFVHQYPYVSISLGLAIHAEPVVGVVYNPYTEQLYTAISGQGAYLTDRHGKVKLPLPGTAAARAAAAEHTNDKASESANPSEEEEEAFEGEKMTLSTSLIAIEWGSIRSGNDWSVKWRTFERLGRSDDQRSPHTQPPYIPDSFPPSGVNANTKTNANTNTNTNPSSSSSSNPNPNPNPNPNQNQSSGPPGGAMVHSLRSFGSAALNLCAVAAGSIDAYWEAGPWPWDFCAGFVIVREAAGLVVDAQRPVSLSASISVPGPASTSASSSASAPIPVSEDDDGKSHHAAKASAKAKASLSGRRCLAVRAGPRAEQEAFVHQFWDCVVGRFEVGGR